MNALTGIGDALLTVLLSVMPPAIIVALIVYMIRQSKPMRPDDSRASGTLAKVAATLGATAILVSIYCAVRSFQLSPESGKFVLQNLTVGAGIFAYLMMLVLGVLQKEIFWIFRKFNLQLDERQVRERQAIFEISYQVTGMLVMFALFALITWANSVATIIVDNGGSVPGHLVWVVVDIVLAIYAIPQIVAAWHRK